MKRISMDTGGFLSCCGFGDHPLSEQDRRDLWQGLDKHGAKIFLPSPTVAEIMSWHNAEQQYTQLLSRHPVKSLTGSAARLAGEMQRRAAKANVKSHRAQHTLTKHQVKVDALILACSIDSGADVIVALDSDISSLQFWMPSDHPIQVWSPTDLVKVFCEQKELELNS